ncbi:hypothetical protein TNCV_70311 [Trichonephila clavipes]|nr:hypothetical protein TNCV_70311 [Trichonephila clavipes]
MKICLLYDVPNKLYMAPQSSDLNPTEHLSDLLERRIRQHNVNSKDMPKSVLKDQWEKISAEKTLRFVSSMTKRLQEVHK